MPVFTVHAPRPTDDETRPAPERFVFLRDGFSIWAFLFGPFWLLYRRLWLALLGYLVLMTVLTAALGVLHAGAGTRFVVLLLCATLLGLEASSLRRWTLGRRGWRPIDIVAADDQEIAERRFFDRWSAAQANPIGFSFPVDRGAPPPTRTIPMPASSLYGDIVGSFPRPGAGR
ncbi:DUF2628 domain-containing protein [Rhodopseudomonas sp. B29]|uniref:DUF2628 domain-containing protein n=1 Tax=Rhodopseudomonas sp. B29 TaxID=95607 RepID=UPI00034BFEB9|nr:DUF2628 domain-containing protein [Rhodopseudomonas sp. B29]